MRWSPDEGPIFELGTLFVELADVAMPNDIP